MELYIQERKGIRLKYIKNSFMAHDAHKELQLGGIIVPIESLLDE